MAKPEFPPQLKQDMLDAVEAAFASEDGVHHARVIRQGEDYSIKARAVTESGVKRFSLDVRQRN